MIEITRDIVSGMAGPKIGHGVVFGKFMPPTNGHLYLLDVARQSCDSLTILVLTLENEPIPGALRYAWIRELYPDCTVIHHTADMPQEPQSPHDVAFYMAWKETIEKHCGYKKIDALFASEPYGYQVAWALGTRFIPVDCLRESVAVSGTAVRADPWKHWDRLHHVVRPYFVKRIAVAGSDHSGKTALARALSARLSTACVNDYGDTLLQDMARNVHGAVKPAIEPADIDTIARGHLAAVAALARQANRVLVLDTDMATIVRRAKEAFGHCPDWVTQHAAQDEHHLTLLTGRDTQARPDALAARNLPFAVIDGADDAARLRQGMDAVMAHFPALKDYC